MLASPKNDWMIQEDEMLADGFKYTLFSRSSLDDKPHNTVSLEYKQQHQRKASSSSRCMNIYNVFIYRALHGAIQ
jgi:hypothetical protein